MSSFAEPLTAAGWPARLALGTAQFGLAYGLNNTGGQPPLNAVAVILRDARAAGLTLLDTAAAYGDSEARLGQLLATAPTADELPPWQVVTKLAAGAPEAVLRQLREALARLRQPAVYGVMFHSFGPLQEQPAAWLGLYEARRLGLTTRVGVSLYHPAEADWLLAENMDFDLVQVPYSVLDQRFGPLLPRLAARGVEVHVRSAFLQGLLLREPAALPAFFRPLAPKLHQLRELTTTAGVPLAAALLGFAAGAAGVRRVVVGVDSPANLAENLTVAQHLPAALALRPALEELAESTTEFILPYTWPTR